jgi:hypothetical protein
MIGVAMAALPRTEQAVARSLAQTADPREALARALRAIGETLGWRVGAVWEPFPDRPEALRCVETWSAVGAAAEAFEAASRLRVEVRDDGRGGADPAAGSGLRGLADRAAALDGTMEVISPARGGTVLRVEIPCGS